jgi:competence protein ComEA
MKTYLMFLLLFISSSYLYADIDNKININTACRDELITLPNIGYGIADRIIEHRRDSPFEAIEDIINISGVYWPTFELIKDRITIDQKLSEKNDGSN